jgi:hypothetical protein
LVAARIRGIWLGHDPGRSSHRLDAAGDHDVGVTDRDLAAGSDDGFQA